MLQTRYMPSRLSLLLYSYLLPLANNNMQTCSEVTKQESGSGDVQWLKYTIAGEAIYAQYQGNAEVDGNPKALQTKSSANSVYFVLAHFWSYTTIDPGMLVPLLSYSFILTLCLQIILCYSIKTARRWYLDIATTKMKSFVITREVHLVLL